MNDTFKDHYEEYYQYEARRGVVYGPEDLSGNARFEHTASIVKEINPQRLLDYGCAHGHYVMNLLKRFPQIQMTGLDIEQININKAIAWAEKEDPIRMPQFICGTVEDLPQFSTYDCILACEVLEHCKDPVAVVEQLKKHLTPNGYIVITTPYGAWEAIGYKEHKGWRAHLHHFERWDLFDMFSEQPDYKLLAVPGNPVASSA